MWHIVEVWKNPIGLTRLRIGVTLRDTRRVELSMWWSWPDDDPTLQRGQFLFDSLEQLRLEEKWFLLSEFCHKVTDNYRCIEVLP